MLCAGWVVPLLVNSQGVPCWTHPQASIAGKDAGRHVFRLDVDLGTVFRPGNVGAVAAAKQSVADTKNFAQHFSFEMIVDWNTKKKIYRLEKFPVLNFNQQACPSKVLLTLPTDALHPDNHKRIDIVQYGELRLVLCKIVSIKI